MDLLVTTAVTLLGVFAYYQSIAWDYNFWLKVFLLAASQYALIKVYRVLLYPKWLSPLRQLPGPKTSNLLLGEELLKFRAETPVSAQLEWSKQWPDAKFIRYMSFAGKEVLLLNSVTAYKGILQTHCYDTVKPSVLSRLVGEVTGTGLLFAEGDYHKQQRRLLTDPFSVPNIRKILPLFQAKTKSLLAVFENALGKKGYSSVDVKAVTSQITMDVIGIAALGVELGEVSGSGDGLWEFFDKMFHQSRVGQLITVVNAFIPIRRFLPIEANREFLRNKFGLRERLRRQVRNRITEMREGTNKALMTENNDILTFMLEEAEKQQLNTGKAPWTEDEIVDHLINFTAAGHETSATTLTWALYVLATRPDIQNRLRTEARTFLEQHPHPDYDHLSSLPFMNNFCREVLRMYSPGHLVWRETTRDLVIDSVFIPKGTQMEMTIAVLHYHPKIWGENAHVFDPDRWDHLTGDAASPYAWEPFIQGPRMCPGKNFALIEIKTMLLELVSAFQFVGIESASRTLLSPEEAVIGKAIKVQNPALTFCPAGPLRIRFEPI
ncbi:cytochrome P450 [Xylariales sp. PMI_506]|nr:cytochrome P450 [Xylariales sp. PMI_506]